MHLIEAAENVIFDIIRDLDDSQPGTNDLLTDTRILTINHDIPTRYIPYVLLHLQAFNVMCDVKSVNIL